MVPMPFTENQKQQALQVAKASIAYGLINHKPVEINIHDYDEIFQQQGCSFVTLYKEGKLRGCVGALQPHQSLMSDIAEHAYAAACKDHRFSPLNENELESIDLHISVLTPQQEILFNSESDLLQQLTPGLDGLTLEDGVYKSTFLPAVWEQLPDKNEFLLHLKRKAGMADDYWSKNIKAYRYQTVSLSE